MISVCFTGHRPDKIGGYKNEDPVLNKFVRNWLREVTRRIIEKFGEVNFISGGAQGVDLIAAEIVMEHKNNYNDKNIYLTMAIPYPEFGEKWEQYDRDILNHYKKVADKCIYIRDYYTGPIVLDLRNHWMVDNSAIVIAVFDGSLGGTRNCFKYAIDNKKKIWRLNPRTGETTKYN